MTMKTTDAGRSSLRATLTAFGVSGFMAVAAPVTAAEMTLQIGTIESPTGANSLGWQAFEQYVEASSDIDIELLHSGQLGDTEKLLEGTMLGINKMAQGDETLTGAYAPMMTWFTPYLFADELVMKEFFASDTFGELNDAMAGELGVRVLAASPYGFYNFIAIINIDLCSGSNHIFKNRFSCCNWHPISGFHTL